jgi:hypothetical protein
MDSFPHQQNQGLLDLSVQPLLFNYRTNVI